MHIRVDDIVEIMVPDDRDRNTGKRFRAKVLRINRDEGKLVVEGINKVWKHLKKSQKNPQGGRLQKEMPIQIANVRLVCPSCGQATRTGARFREDGSKYRACKKCGADAGVISPAKKSYSTSGSSRGGLTKSSIAPAGSGGTGSSTKRVSSK